MTSPIQGDLVLSRLLKTEHQEVTGNLPHDSFTDSNLPVVPNTQSQYQDA